MSGYLKFCIGSTQQHRQLLRVDANAFGLAAVGGIQIERRLTSRSLGTEAVMGTVLALMVEDADIR
ncbi:MAG: hypothetical protein H6822_23760 [Planctomycetaceae bacterium]|nr:hypothetical protein [Planctomycetales bacterium]MCB9925216.1 hypothetical protein [Planctomycetaceae bacterium]